MIIWGLSGLDHDAAIAVFENQTLLYAIQFERISGIKNDNHINIDHLDILVDRYGKPQKILYHENLFLKWTRTMRRKEYDDFWILKKIAKKYQAKLFFGNHHQSHAANAYYTSPHSFHKDSLIFVVDAIGEWNTISVWTGKDGVLKKIHHQNYPKSLGLLYSSVTQAVGLEPNKEEFVLMGMSAYGKPTSFHDMEKLYNAGVNFHKGFDWKGSAEDLAASVQKFYENQISQLIKEFCLKYSTENIILSGGTAFNCLSNGKIKNHIWINNNPGDSGNAVGAVLASTKTFISNPVFVGEDFSNKVHIHDFLNEIQQNKIVAVMQGRCEWGPRALGNRSILADPRQLQIKTTANYMKNRQQYRPFGCMVLSEYADKYFKINTNQDYSLMQYAVPVKKIEEIPAVVHVDGTSRIQTVNQCHPFRKYLWEWYKSTDCPVLLNTSLNVKNQPLMQTLEQKQQFEKDTQIKIL